MGLGKAERGRDEGTERLLRADAKLAERALGDDEAVGSGRRTRLGGGEGHDLAIGKGGS